MELFKIICVVTPRNPDLQVAFWPVLLIEVLNCTLIMSGSVEMRIIVKPILDGAANYCLRFDEAIRLLPLSIRIRYVVYSCWMPCGLQLLHPLSESVPD